MTAYSVWVEDTSPTEGEKLALRAGAYELRITSILAISANAWLDRRSSASISGGSTVPIVPFREGAPAASATARYGSVSVTGGASVRFGIRWQAPQPSGFPVDFTVAPGSVFTMEHTGGAQYTSYFGITFEELLLAWHY